MPTTLNFVVPEPASFVLLGSFLLTLVLLRRLQGGRGWSVRLERQSPDVKDGGGAGVSRG